MCNHAIMKMVDEKFTFQLKITCLQVINYIENLPNYTRSFLLSKHTSKIKLQKQIKRRKITPKHMFTLLEYLRKQNLSITVAFIDSLL